MNFSSQADRFLVSSMTCLKIGVGSKRNCKRAKGLNNDGVMSQQNDREMAEPTRINPHRLAKCTEKGQLGATALSQRTVGNLQTKVPELKKPQTMQVDQNEASKANSDEINPNDPYEKIRLDQNKLNENIVCDVCLDDEDDDNNEIVLCDLCLVAVHQVCYGSELLGCVPEGNWYCARCRDLLAEPKKKCTEIKCVFCPKIDGVIKPISLGKDGKQKMWAHVICVNWFKGLWFKNERNEAVEGQISSLAMSIQCNTQSCKKTQGGVI